MSLPALNMLDVDVIVDKFLADSQQGISYLHKTFFHTDSNVSLQALILSLRDEVRSGVVTYINKNEDIDEIYPYLFYIVNAYCKKNSIQKIKKKIEYLCPACLFLGKENLVVQYKTLECGECSDLVKTEKDAKSIVLFKTFAVHNKHGYHCKDCNRFIPHPMDDSENISCPYFDCSFYGPISDLKGMHHPNVQYNPESVILDSSIDSMPSMKDMISDSSNNSFDLLSSKQELSLTVKMLSEIIESQSNTVHYSSSDFTVKHKVLVYQAFKNIIAKYPEEMVDYLIYSSRSGGFQHKVFQEYIRLLEDEFPIVFKKNSKVYRIESLLDENLDLFSGISTFSGILNENLEIKNGTKEFYIGGRKGTIAKPYYIGKLLSIVNSKNNEPVLDLVKEYSFSKIKMKDIIPGTEVIVTHLRVPPHYQMGGMVYINRIRKKIVDKAKSIIQKNIND
jgi:ferredoxin-like protein FixX